VHFKKTVSMSLAPKNAAQLCETQLQVSPGTGSIVNRPVATLMDKAGGGVVGLKISLFEMGATAAKKTPRDRGRQHIQQP
jgi:hypothetical protein